MNPLKRVPLLVLVLVLCATSWAQKKQPNQAGDQPTDYGPMPNLAIESTTHDFGELKSGTPLRYAFKIKNTGKVDLVIESVSPG
jgi:hypothetical protein